MKILFILVRCIPFADVVITIWHYIKSNISEQECIFFGQSVGWLTLFGILLAEVILMLRTWAVYERARAVAIGLIVWTAVTWVPSMASLGIFLNSLRYGPRPPGVPSFGCFVISGRPISFVCWVLLMIFEAAILALMVYKAVKDYRLATDSAMFKTIFRDGTVFYFYLFVLSTANVIVILTTAAGLGSTLLVLAEGIVHSTLTVRVILNLRALACNENQFSLSTFSARVGGAVPSAEFATDSSNWSADSGE
ncbi:hypothetical protein PsYK624_121240 [Phanerochaete sordida]|uniref:Uncharacterized protein n=1 Tax=Phanerochaete sordida TaxID=48140 RepID=A0A9P3GHY0_9APHY|nr:hypothetical protein PsYK624_121240 [Phanerochaete sordida]